MNSHLEAAERAAREAGGILKTKFREAREIHSKGFRDLVTDADFAANDHIRQVLARAFPDIPMRSEEDREPAQEAEEWKWVVDPLDGTTNYSRQFPIFCVSIGLVHAREPVAGVVYDPLRDELYAAARGEGATLNGAPIRVSRVSSLAEAIVGYEFSSKPELRKTGILRYAELAQQSFTARIGGAAALSLCYVAAGRVDVYFHLSLHAWDVAAGLVIVQESGGQTTTLAGGPATPYSGDFLVTNGALHPTLVGYFGSQA